VDGNNCLYGRTIDAQLRMLLAREVWSSNPAPAKPYTTLQAVHRRFNICGK